MKRALMTVVVTCQVLFGFAAYAAESPAPQETKETKVSFSDFSVEEFVGNYSIKQLSDALKKSKILSENENCDTVNDLNKLLKRAELYDKLTAANKQLPSETLTKLKQTYDKTKKEDDLKELNRIALEEFYPQETPKSPNEENKAAPVTTLEEVIVTATRTEKNVAEAPGDVHVVTASDIDKRNVLTYDEALNTTAGVFDQRATGLMDEMANISIRGVPNGTTNRTQVLLDGIPMNEAYYGGVSWNGAVGSVERIEVVEGPFSSLYGGYAMGGVVNVITKMPEKSEFTFNGGYGSAWDRGKAMDDLWRGYMSYGDKIYDKFSFFVAYGWQSTNGYPNQLAFSDSGSCPAGTTGCKSTTTSQGYPAYIVGDSGNNTFWNDSINVKAAYDFSKETKLLLSYQRTRGEYNYDTPDTYLKDANGQSVYLPDQYSYIAGNSRGETNINFYTLTFNTEIGTAKVKFNFGLNDYAKNYYTFPSFGAVIGSGPGSETSTPSQNYYSDIQATFPVLDRNILTVGASFQYGKASQITYNLTNWPDQTSQAGTTYEARGSDDTYSIFVQDEISILKNLTAYLGVRGDYWITRGYQNPAGDTGNPESYGSRSADHVSPKLSLVYNPFDLTTVRTSVGHAFRPPTVYEMYTSWSIPGYVTYNGNPDLKPETVTSWDFSVEQKLWEGAKIKGTYFENYFQDLVTDKTVSVNSVTYYTVYEKINAGRAQTKGIVAEVEQKIDKLRLFANMTLLTDSKITSNSADSTQVGKKLVNQPMQMYNAGAEYSYGPVTAGLTGSYVGKRYSDPDNSDTTNNVQGSYDPFFLLNGKISCQVQKNVSLSFSVNNILDRQYYSYYLAPGRSWFSGLTIKF